MYYLSKLFLLLSFELHQEFANGFGFAVSSWLGFTARNRKKPTGVASKVVVASRHGVELENRPGERLHLYSTVHITVIYRYAQHH